MLFLCYSVLIVSKPVSRERKSLNLGEQRRFVSSLEVAYLITDSFFFFLVLPFLGNCLKEIFIFELFWCPDFLIYSPIKFDSLCRFCFDFLTNNIERQKRVMITSSRHNSASGKFHTSTSFIWIYQSEQFRIQMRQDA